MKRIRLLLAGPGTGKTSKVKELVKSYNPQKVLVVSFTNATINDLLKDFEREKIDITRKNCMTLHKLALKLNHLPRHLHILNGDEEYIVKSVAKSLGCNYEECCRNLDCVDFNMMITDSVEYIKTNPEFVKEKLGEVDLLVVDEFQDFNANERDLIFQIASLSGELLILCDDDQCIYGFKNADSSGVIELNKDSKVEKVPHDNICYRCPADVVKACNNLIANNKNRVFKEWKPGNDKKGLSFMQTQSGEDTAKYILGKISEIKKDSPLASIMILSNVGFVSKPLVDFLKENGIEFSNMWQEGMDRDLMRKLWEVKLIYGEDKLLNLIFLAKSWTKNNSKRKKIFNDLMEKTIVKGADKKSIVAELLKLGVVDEKISKLVNQPPELEHFFEENKEYGVFSEFVKNDANIERELEELEQKVTKSDEFKQDGINLMSIYKSKGLQANHVFVLGLVEGILPNESRGIDSIEAQRRVLFVAMSRARDGLYLMSQVEWPAKDTFTVDKSKFKHFRRDMVKGQTSLFVRELQLEQTS